MSRRSLWGTGRGGMLPVPLLRDKRSEQGATPLFFTTPHSDPDALQTLDATKR